MHLNQCCSTSFSHYKSTFVCTSTTYMYVIVGPLCIKSSEVDVWIFQQFFEVPKRLPRRISEPSTIPLDFLPSNSQALPLPRLASLIVSWEEMLMDERDPCVLYSTLATKQRCFKVFYVAFLKTDPPNSHPNFSVFFLFVVNFVCCEFSGDPSKNELKESGFWTLWP